MPIPLLSEPDPYREAAARLFGVEESAVTPKQREDAKEVLRSQMCLATPERIAELLDASYREPEQAELEQRLFSRLRSEATILAEDRALRALGAEVEADIAQLQQAGAKVTRLHDFISVELPAGSKAADLLLSASSLIHRAFKLPATSPEAAYTAECKLGDSFEET